MTGQYIYSAPLENAMKDIARALNRIANAMEAQEKRARDADELGVRLAHDMYGQGFDPARGDEPCG